MPSSVPEEPLTLDEFPPSSGASKRNDVFQGLEITFTEEAGIAKILESISSAANAQVSLGKKPIIILDGKPLHPIQSLPRDHNLLYKRSSRSNDLKLYASLSLKDATARAKLPKSQELDLNDPALLALKQNLAQHQQKKQSNTTILVKDSSKLPPAKSGRQALKANKKSSLSFLKSHRQLLSERNATTRSMPTSPSLGGVTPNKSTRPDIKAMKQDALKFSFLHLLAVCSYTKQDILTRLKCKPDELEPLLEKYQGRMDGSKFTLSDKGYKELDIWRFPYRDQSERESARDRAIKAYDRQRISVREPVWQLLLPKDERNKGKVLSKLNLHHGAIERMKTPQIHVESSSGNDGSASGPEEGEPRKGRLDPSSAKSNVRSSSQDPIKTKSVGEKEVLSKQRLKANEPKKPVTSQPGKGKEPKASQPAPTKKPASKRGGAAANSKVKSEEFVHDSDEDMDMVEVLSPEPPQKTSPKPQSPATTASTKPMLTKSVPVKKTTVKKELPPKDFKREPGSTAEPKAPASSRPNPKPTSKPAGKTSSKEDSVAQTSKAKVPQPTDATQKPVMMARSLSHKRSNSSPKKPSPLGSSPPTNASDMENESSIKSSKSSSSSNSPLINQRRELVTARKAPSGSNAVVSGTSDRGTKRKANDIDPDVHSHEVGNGATHYQSRLPKRRLSSDDDSLRSDSTSDSRSLLSKKNMEDAQIFMRQWRLYQKNLQDLKSMRNPPPEKVEKLHRLHKKLTEHKARIWKAAR